jgi:hypothetical protein
MEKEEWPRAVVGERGNSVSSKRASRPRPVAPRCARNVADAVTATDGRLSIANLPLAKFSQDRGPSMPFARPFLCRRGADDRNAPQGHQPASKRGTRPVRRAATMDPLKHQEAKMYLEPGNQYEVENAKEITVVNAGPGEGQFDYKIDKGEETCVELKNSQQKKVIQPGKKATTVLVINRGKTRLDVSAQKYKTPAVLGSQYQIGITMGPDTVTALQNGNFFLYGFKAVQTTQSGGAPLVWISVSPDDLLENTTISWSESYEAYISTVTEIGNGVTISASSDVPILLGETATTGPGGQMTVTEGGTGQAITIANGTQTQYSCGISQEQSGGFIPLCAFPLFGENDDVIAPIEKVLLMFATAEVNTGTVIEQAFSPGMLVDLTADNQRNLAFDINQGWSTLPDPNQGWGFQCPANASLVPMLIDNSFSPGGFRRRSLVLGRA